MSPTDPVASSDDDSPPTHARSALVPAGQFVLAGIGVYVAAESMSLGLWTALGPGPGLLPLVLGVALAGLTATWAVQWLLERRRKAADRVADTAVVGRAAGVEDAPAVDDDAAAAQPEQRLDRPYVLGVIGGLLLLAAVMEVVGFQIAMSVFLFAELTLLGRQRWWLSAAVALIGSVGVFALFDRVLAVQLPLSSIPFLSSLGL